jgi:pimeloyl-ACP methyl ester carboxylesterase
MDAIAARAGAGRGGDVSAPTETRITVAGCAVRVMRGGGGAPLLYLHGASGAGEWSPMMARLAERYDVIVPEHPGFGASDTPDWLDNIHDLAHFYVDFIRALDLDKVHLVGLSLGGWIAAEMAVRSTRYIETLTLAAAAGLHVNGVAQMDPFLVTDEERLRAFFYDETLAEPMIARLLTPEQEDTNLKNRAATARMTWQPRGHDPNLHKWLHQIDVPTLLIWGDTDRMFPVRLGEEYQRLIPGAELMVFPQCGHLPQVEKLDDFVAAVSGFIARSAS